MKTYLLSIILILYAVYNVSCQQDLLLIKHKDNEKERLIREGNNIRVHTKDQVLKGKFEIVNDSVIRISGNNILLPEIQKIRTKSLASKIAGGTLTGVGTIFLGTGTYIFLNFINDDNWVSIIGIVIAIPIAMVGVIFTTSGLMLATIGKNYRHELWNYGVVRVNTMPEKPVDKNQINI